MLCEIIQFNDHNCAFRYVAKIIQQRYGNKIAPANFDIEKNLSTVIIPVITNIATINNAMSIL